MSRYVETSLAVTVVRCHECPHWYGFADDKLDGWRIARAHEKRAHRGEVQALRALNASLWRRRSGAA